MRLRSSGSHALLPLFRRLLCLLMALLAPAVAPAEQPRAGRLPDSVLMRYYEGSIFVGDSLIRMFRNYVKDIRAKDPSFFPGVRFYSAYNYQLRAASREKASEQSSLVNLLYKSKWCTMAEIMQGEQPPRLFLLAGLNDKIYDHLDRADDYLEKIAALRDGLAPDTALYFLSLTPVTRVAEKKYHLSAKISAYNAWLERKCGELGAVYVDIATDLKDEKGLLPMAISHDGYFHLEEVGYDVVVRTLLDFAQREYELGRWTPPETGGADGA